GSPAGAAGASCAGAAPPETSTAMMDVPTSTVVPSGKCSSRTTPSYGMGSSTAAFAVSTSQTTWPSVTVSPGWTYHLRISASVRPSLTSGILNSRTDAFVIVVTTLSSVRQRAVDGIEHPVQVGEVGLLQTGRRVRGVVTAHPQHRGLQVVEAPLGDPRGDLRAGTEEHRCLVDHDQPARPLHRRLDGVEVDRGDRAQVEHLQGAALLGGRVGDLLAELHHRAVGGEGEVRAGPHHARG